MNITLNLIIIMPIFLFGCSTFGESNLQNFNDHSGRNVPTDPLYKIEKISEGKYSLAVHQDSIFMSPSYVRKNILLRAAAEIIREKCIVSGEEVIRSSLKTEESIFGWVHLQGEFKCGVRKIAKKKIRKETKTPFRSGTGFFISDTGHIITSNHVINNTSEIKVVVKTGQTFPAKLVRADTVNDLALLKIEYSSNPVRLGQTTKLEKGEEIFTIGYPRPDIQGQGQKATFGRINALSGVHEDFRFIQIDVPIQPGNSGGPLIDSTGRVIGVISSTLNALKTLSSSGTLPQNVNYALKSNYIIPLAGAILQGDVFFKGNKEAHDKVPVLIRNTESSVVLITAK